ncbi:MAG: hypothetical protein HY057_01515 [Rhodospirillales bacterium]|nr:hypothetical protein [Rhodospirillales bacterium]
MDSDRLFGVATSLIEPRIDHQTKIVVHRAEQIDHESAPYPVIASLFRRLRLDRGDVFWDLGCGYGQVLICGALLNRRARFRGVELLGERAHEGRRIARRLGLANVEIVSGHVHDVDFGGGDCFFVFDPFLGTTLARVIKRLCRIAERRPIRIASFGMTNEVMARLDWLRPLPPERGGGEGVLDLRLFTSR